MLRIGKTYLKRSEGSTQLCADISTNGRGVTLWFSVDSVQEDWLALGRADPFVMALLPGAMRGGHEIVCEDTISERLHYQLVNGLIPTLAFAGELYHEIRITAPLTTEKVPNKGAVGTGFSGGVDCLYTIMRHKVDSELPLTHIVVFNTGSQQREKSTLKKIFQRAQAFGLEQNIQPFFVDTNFKEMLSDFIGGTYTFRNLSCALALQGLLKTYLVSSGPNAAKIDLNLRKVSNYDLLTVSCSSTESLSIYLSGIETTRNGKLAALTQWEPSWHWLNACTVNEGEYLNCGHCKKCIRDMTILYALGQLDKYKMVFDTDDYLQHLPERIGYVLASSNGHNSGAQVVKILMEQNVSIPQAAYTYEKIFRFARQRNVEIGQEGGV